MDWKTDTYPGIYHNCFSSQSHQWLRGSSNDDVNRLRFHYWCIYWLLLWLMTNHLVMNTIREETALRFWTDFLEKEAVFAFKKQNKTKNPLRIVVSRSDDKSNVCCCPAVRPAPKQSVKEEAAPFDERKIKRIQRASLNMECRVDRSFDGDVCADGSAAIDFHPSGKGRLECLRGPWIFQKGKSGQKDRFWLDNAVLRLWLAGCRVWGCQLDRPVCHISCSVIRVCVLYWSQIRRPSAVSNASQKMQRHVCDAREGGDCFHYQTNYRSNTSQIHRFIRTSTFFSDEDNWSSQIYECVHAEGLYKQSL